jgi:chemotaxis protein CheD
MSTLAVMAAPDDTPTEVFLVPGALHCSAAPAIVTTVLGSCVAVCLWDSRHRVGGINHYILPQRRGDDLATARYGDVAIGQLVDAISRLADGPSSLSAKLFGGANVLPFNTERDTVGQQNVDLALAQLRRHRIPVVARRTGGESGLLVKFHTHSGLALVRPVTA